jgi:hypothetical protein
MAAIEYSALNPTQELANLHLIDLLFLQQLPIPHKSLSYAQVDTEKNRG